MDGEHKVGVEIVVTYQAVNAATGKTITMDVYDEAHALDAGKSVAAMTEVAATGRYYAAFTPDAEGEWIVVKKNTTDSNGEVVKAFSVGGHNIDGIGDAVTTVDGKVDTIDGKVDTVDTVADAIKAVTDVESGVKADVATLDGKVVALNDLSAANVATELGTYDAATGAEVAALNNVSTTEIATELETYDAVKKSELDSVQGGSETLETIKSAVDALGSPAMVG